MEAALDFEKPILSLEKKMTELQELSKQEGVDFSHEIKVLERKVQELIEKTFSHLNPWQRVQLSRHPNRPYTRDYIDILFPDFLELHGDRFFSDDFALIGGIASWPPATLSPAQKASQPILIVGHQKGRTTKQKMERNFGMAKPDGYRKAMRLFKMADRFGLPILTFIDTPGAYPGIDAEERGQSQAIAESIRMMFGLQVPIVSVVIGEGGSGGALAIGVADAVLMQEFSTYSVISPESCASILWSDATRAEEASTKLKMTPSDLKRLEVIDDVIEEPKGGAHRDWIEAARLVSVKLNKHLTPLLKLKGDSLKKSRTKKFRQMGSIALAQLERTN